MPRRPYLTERDIALIEDLYNLGGMNIRQIWRIHFSKTSLDYAKRRIYMLKDRKVIINEGHAWRATVKGLTNIGIDVKTRPDKIITDQNRSLIIKLSEIHSNLYNTGWEWLTSRVAKEKFALDRLSKLDGILYNTYTSQHYTVYLLSKTPYPETIRRIQNEIQRLSIDNGLQRTIVFAESVEAMKKFGTDTCRVLELYMLPYPYGLKVLKSTVNPDWLDIAINTTLHPNHVMSTRELHADRIAEIGGQQYYITELVTNNIVKRYHLGKYGYDQAEKDRPVKVLCLPGQIKALRESYAAESYPHIELLTV